MKYDIKYNSQRDNFNFDGKFSGNTQCFSTSAWMFMSYYDYSIDVFDDKQLAKYVDDIEVTVGTPGIAEEIQKKNPSIIGKTSLYWEVQRQGISKWLNTGGNIGVAICDFNSNIDQIKQFLMQGPVIVGTKKLGGLRGGHIILAIGYDDENIICHDPYGDAKTNYTNQDGKYVYYEDSLLVEHFSNKILYWRVN